MRIYILEYLIFLFNFLSHLTLFILNLLYNNSTLKIICNKDLSFNNYDKLFFSIGHLLISFVMLFRIGINLSGTIIVSLIGSIAHSFLFISNLFTILKLHKISLFDIIFMVGQIGMIYTYCIEHIISDVKSMTINEKLRILGTFIILAFYYLYNSYKTTSIIKYGKIFVCFVYLGLILLFYLHNEKYNFIKIF